MQRCPNEPGFDQGLVLPECIPDVTGFAVDADHGLQLRCRHDLRLDAADVADDLNQILLWCRAREVVTSEPELMHLRPGHVSGDGALGLQLRPTQSKSLRPRVTNWARRGPVPTSSIGDPISSPMRSM